MAVILALDASTEVCSVALLVNGHCDSLHSSEPRSHAQRLLPMVDQLLQKNGVALSNVDAVAFGSGPGSFTGLRIGLGVAQGLAFGAGLPMIGISSLEAMAVMEFADVAPSTRCCVSVIDARMDELYWSAHALDSLNRTSRPIVEPRLDAPAEVLRQIQSLLSDRQTDPVAVVGSGVSALRDLQCADILGQRVLLKDNASPSAIGVAHLAWARWASGDVHSAQEAQLTYLRNSVAWNKRAKVRK